MRYIYRHRHDKNFMAGIEFYNDGHKLAHAPWELEPELWMKYTPKRETDIKSSLIRGIELNVHRIANSLSNKALQDSLRPYAREYIAHCITNIRKVTNWDQPSCDIAIQTACNEFIKLIKDTH